MSDSVQQELLEQAMAGDDDALSVLLTFLEPQIFKWFSSAWLIRSDSALGAGDLTQETLLGIWQGFPSFNTPAYPAFRQWVFEVAQNVFRNQIRSISTQKRKHTRQDADDQGRLLVEFFTKHTKSPRSELGQKELVELIFAAIDALPDPSPSILRLRLLDNESFAAIGERLGLDGHAVQMRYHRALRFVRRIVGSFGKSPGKRDDDDESVS